MKKTKLLTAILTCTILMLFSTGPVMADKDTFITAQASPPKSLNIYQASSRGVLNISYQIFDPIVERDPKTGEIKPHLATSWKLLDDRTWEFKLRPGVTFHSGNPFNAESVRYTIMERILSPDQKSPQLSGWSWCENVEVVDELTFLVKTKKPYPLVLERMNILFPMDPKWTKEMISKHGEEYFSRHANGTGPFKLVKLIEGRRLELEKYSGYWKKGVPSYNKLTIRFIKESSTRVAELLSGGIDDAGGIPTDLVTKLEENSNLTINEVPLLRFYFWQFDSMGRSSATPEALKDPRVRRAIWHAIDRKTIVENLLGGHGTYLNIPLNPHQFGAVTDMPAPEYDPEKAKMLLKEAGYADGFTMTAWSTANSYQPVNEACSSYLEKVGIKLTYKKYGGRWGDFSKLMRAGKTDGAMGLSWGSYNIFDPDSLWPYFFMIPEAAFNYAGDQELSDWLHEARSTMDMEKRKALYKKSQERIIKMAYWMPIYIIHTLAATDKDFHYEIGIDQVPRWQYGVWR